jgi:hypothetical protein
MKHVCGDAKMPADKWGLWFCTRDPNHEGPCAAIPVPAVDEAEINGRLAMLLAYVIGQAGNCGVQVMGGAWQVTTPYGDSATLELLASLALHGLVSLSWHTLQAEPLADAVAAMATRAGHDSYILQQAAAILRGHL